MTTGVVVDASVSAVWYIDDEDDPVADEALRFVVKYGRTVPELFHFEIRHVILTATRRGRRAGQLRTTNRALESLPIHTDIHPNFDNVFELATKHNLTFYDATYLELALRHGLPLATLDNAPARAAESESALWAP